MLIVVKLKTSLVTKKTFLTKLKQPSVKLPKTKSHLIKNFAGLVVYEWKFNKDKDNLECLQVTCNTAVIRSEKKKRYICNWTKLSSSCTF